MANSLNLNAAYHYIFRNLSMMAYIIEIQNLLVFHDFDQSEPGRLINSVYIFIL